MQVSTPSADLEERARTLLADHKQPRHSGDRPCVAGARSNLSFPNAAKASIGEDLKLSSYGCFGEKVATCAFQEHGRQSGGVRHVGNVNLAPATENCSTRTISLIHDIYEAGDGSTYDHTCGDEERTDWLCDDPVLPALLHRFCEIEAEIERRHCIVKEA